MLPVLGNTSKKYTHQNRSSFMCTGHSLYRSFESSGSYPSSVSAVFQRVAEFSPKEVKGGGRRMGEWKGEEGEGKRV